MHVNLRSAASPSIVDASVAAGQGTFVTTRGETFEPALAVVPLDLGREYNVGFVWLKGREDERLRTFVERSQAV